MARWPINNFSMAETQWLIRWEAGANAPRTGGPPMEKNYLLADKLWPSSHGSLAEKHVHRLRWSLVRINLSFKLSDMFNEYISRL
jgi:hypothetical protein